MKSNITLLLFLFSLSLWASADVCGIELVQGARGAFAHGDRVEFNLDFSHDETGGVRIFGRPWSDGAPTSGFGAHGSGLYTDADGLATGWFTINSGVRVVDEIRVTVLNSDQSELLREFWIPVKYHFGNDGANNFTYSADEKMASFLHGNQATINFDYNINWAQGARIFVRPFTNGELTPGYSASGSPIYTGEGSASANFTINSGINTRVEYLRVRMVNPDQTILLGEFFLPVNWYWSNVAIDNFSVSGPAFPLNSESLTVNFDYETTVAGGVRIYPRPFTNGGLTPNYGACGSPVFSGTGSDDCSFSISASNQRVDHIRIMAVSPDQTESYLEVYFPVNKYFGNFPLQSLVTCPPALVRLEPGEPINIKSRIFNGSGANARIFPRPFTEGDLTAGYSASGSPSYNTGSGALAANFTINGNGGIVDQIRYRVTNDNQSSILADYFVDGRYTFGSDFLPTSAHSPNAQEHLSWSFGPNPLQDRATLRLQTEESQQLNVRLVDALGRTLHQWNDYELIAGFNQELAIDAQALDLTDGLYFLQLQGADFQLTETFVVSR